MFRPSLNSYHYYDSATSEPSPFSTSYRDRDHIVIPPIIIPRPRGGWKFPVQANISDDIYFNIPKISEYCWIRMRDPI